MSKKKKILGILKFSLLTIVSVLALYCFFGAPSLSPEMAMHRKEAAELIGPSKVIAADVASDGTYDRILLGETEYGYCLFEYRDEWSFWDRGDLTYIARDDKRVCFISDQYYDVEFQKKLPVFAVSGNARAVSARLTLKTESDVNPIYYSGTFSAWAQLRQSCYFLFEMDITDMDISIRCFWEDRLKGNSWAYDEISGTATLELFDRDGNLIETRVTEFPASK